MFEKIFDKDNKYTGAVVLGLHDALVGTIGTVIGMAFALNDSRLVMLAAIITGVSAGLSMSASNYLAEKAEGNIHAVHAGISTGLAYVATMVMLVLPLGVFPRTELRGALVVMLLIATSILLCSSYYISRIRERMFMRTFAEMFIICTAVSVIAFGIGQTARLVLGIEV